MMPTFDWISDALPAGGRFETPLLEIPGLEGARPLSLYIPADYDASEATPVAYFFDGQNIFEGQAGGPPGWELHQILDIRAAQGLPVPLVVGIHHGRNRDEELSPWPAEKGQTPRAEALLDWLLHSLHPELARHFTLSEQPQDHIVGGSSLGGLLALYAGFHHSDFFGRVIAMSPSLWVGQGAIFEDIAQVDAMHLDGFKLYLDCGALENDWDAALFWSEAELDALEAEAVAPLAHASVSLEDSQPDEDAPDETAHEEDEDSWDTDPLEDAEYLVDILEAKGFEDGEHFLWVPDPEGEHNEWHWSKRLPLALNWVLDQ